MTLMCLPFVHSYLLPKPVEDLFSIWVYFYTIAFINFTAGLAREPEGQTSCQSLHRLWLSLDYNLHWVTGSSVFCTKCQVMEAQIFCDPWIYSYIVTAEFGTNYFSTILHYIILSNSISTELLCVCTCSHDVGTLKLKIWI